MYYRSQEDSKYERWQKILNLQEEKVKVEWLELVVQLVLVEKLELQSVDEQKLPE